MEAGAAYGVDLADEAVSGAWTRPDAGADPTPTVDLAARARQGDQAAFEDLMRLTETRVLGLAWRLLGDRELARDAAQETYLRAYRSLGTFRTGASFPAWICGITVNVCRDLGRKRGPRPLAVEDLDTLAPPESGRKVPVAEEALLLAQRRALVQRALGDLPEGERAALVLRDLQGFPTEDVARVLGVRPVTIRSQVASARQKLRAACARLIHPVPGGPS